MGPDGRLTTAAERRRRAALAEWAAEARTHAAPADVVAVAATSLADMAGLDARHELAPPLLRERSREVGLPEPPDGLVVDAWDLGVVHEATLDGSNRHRRGVHYTPRSVATGLAEIALEGADAVTTVCDPAVGGGAFLLAAAEMLRRDGSPVDHVVGRLRGIDIDPLAVAVTEASVALWAGADGIWSGACPRLVVADALHVDTVDLGGFWAGDRADVVIGNPPFQSQLASATARDRATAAGLRRRWRVEPGPYCDTAGWFLLAALELTAPGGRIVLVLPQSLLASADAAPVRERLSEAASLTGLWTGGRGVFDAEVRVCAPVLTVGPTHARPEAVRWWSGPDVAAGATIPAPTIPGRWSELLAHSVGVPAVDGHASTPLGSWCDATAGFRAQFYGLAPHTTDLAPDGVDGSAQAAEPARFAAGSGMGHTRSTLLDEDALPLVTVGMIEPLRCLWGSGTQYRYAGRRWIAPAVDLVALEAADATLARWVRDRLHPKVLVATQTKVVEAVVDVDGRWIPSTPVIAVTAPPDRLGHLVAALTSPVATAAALAATAGTALSGDTIKLSARQVLGLPTPVDRDAWDEGARLADGIAAGSMAAGAGLEALGRVMISAAGAGVADPDALFAWWWDRVPKS